MTSCLNCGKAFNREEADSYTGDCACGCRNGVFCPNCGDPIDNES